MPPVSDAASLALIAPTCLASSPSTASTLPPEAYGSDEVFTLETEHLFRSGWIPLCRAEQLREPGSYRSVDVLGTPLVVTRDRDGHVHVLSRTCRHRWAEVVTGEGVAPALQCPYHLWTYGLDGHLAGAPEMQGVEGFCKEESGLSEYRHEVWQGFVMVNLDGQAESTSVGLAALDDYVEPYDLAGYQTIAHTAWDICDWDWKIMVDNFMECYHHMGPHRASLEDRWPAKLSYTDQGGDGFSVMWTCQAPGYPEAESPMMSPGAPTLRPEHFSKQLIFIAYPLLQVVLAPGFMYWLQVLPVAPGKIELYVDVALSPAAMAESDIEDRKVKVIDGVIAIHKEDLGICAAVQRAVRHGAKGTGRLSLLEQPLWEFYRYLGRRFGLIEPAPGARDEPGPTRQSSPLPAETTAAAPVEPSPESLTKEITRV
jgi:phenylpropionate dioxygenase-like ring-hydroxylating dioxygenase large terminal subunit